MLYRTRQYNTVTGLIRTAGEVKGDLDDRVVTHNLLLYPEIVYAVVSCAVIHSGVRIMGDIHVVHYVRYSTSFFSQVHSIYSANDGATQSSNFKSAHT